MVQVQREEQIEKLASSDANIADANLIVVINKK